MSGRGQCKIRCPSLPGLRGERRHPIRLTRATGKSHSRRLKGHTFIRAKMEPWAGPMAEAMAPNWEVLMDLVLTKDKGRCPSRATESLSWMRCRQGIGGQSQTPCQLRREIFFETIEALFHSGNSRKHGAPPGISVP